MPPDVSFKAKNGQNSISAGGPYSAPTDLLAALTNRLLDFGSLERLHLTNIQENHAYTKYTKSHHWK